MERKLEQQEVQNNFNDCGEEDEENDEYEYDFDEDGESTDCNFSGKCDKKVKQGSSKSSNQNIDQELLRVKCQQKMDFDSRLEQIDSVKVDMKYKIQMLQALKQQMQEKLADQTSFRHVMRKQVLKKQKKISSTFTKTTAAHSNVSTIANGNNFQNIYTPSNKNPSSHSPISIHPTTPQLSISNNPQLANILAAAIQQNQEDNLVSKRCSIFSVQTQVIYSGRKDGQSQFSYKFDNTSHMIENPSRRRGSCIVNKDLIKSCKTEETSIKEIETSLIPVKNERNRISELLEDYKDDLIVNKQYLRDVTGTFEARKIYTEQLMKRINSMSRSGFTMNNRENNTANMSMMNTTRLNATFVDEAVSKFKAVKDFFKIKIFQSKDSTNNNQGSSTSRSSNGSNQYPMTNRILDFN